MGWKDYLYFTRREKRAIVAMLILIGIAIILCIISKKDKITVTEPDREFTQALDSFRASLKSASIPYSHKMKPGETIELNKADTSSLKTIPGVGPSYAQRIVKYRESLGGFVSKSQLREIWGVDNELFNQIEPFLTLEPTINKLRINNVNFNKLNSHPYISYRQAKVIMDIRTRKGKIQSINRLTLLDEFNNKDIERLRPYISFE